MPNFDGIFWNGNLVGGWTDPFKKICSSKWESSPGRGENEKYLKPPPRNEWDVFFFTRGYTYSYSKSLKRVNNWELKDKAQGRCQLTPTALDWSGSNGNTCHVSSVLPCIEKRRIFTQTILLPSGKLTWQWRMDLVEGVFPIEHVEFPLPC